MGVAVGDMEGTDVGPASAALHWAVFRMRPAICIAAAAPKGPGISPGPSAPRVFGASLPDILSRVLLTDLDQSERLHASM
jgi:hypothetical protein